jgi:hypothetical protein
MQIIKIGKRYINLDNVTYIEEANSRIRVNFNTVDGGSSGEDGDWGLASDWVDFRDQDAEVLRWYLNDFCADVQDVEKLRETFVSTPTL